MLSDVPLSKHSTMRLGGPAAHLAEIHTYDDLYGAVKWAKKHDLPMIMIGGGSNIVWSDKGFSGLVMVNKLRGIDVIEQPDGSSTVNIAAGEIWDTVVERTVAMGLSGIEALSLIPGTTGATPVQNVGAYGQEIADTLVSVEVYDQETGKLTTITNDECNFSYRNSRFKSDDRDRFFITGITLKLNHADPKPPFYASLQAYLDKNKIATFTPQTIRDAVIAIRTSKLPDPAKVANNGSFFGNPIVSSHTFDDIQSKYPHVVHWDMNNGAVKLSAAWLIERAGFRSVHDIETGMATWTPQPLVLVNEHAKNTADLLKFRNKIIDKVDGMFHVRLEQEPELIGDN